MNNFNKIYEAFFKKRNHISSSGKPDLELLDFVLEELGLPTDKDNTELLNKLVLEFSERKLPQRVFTRYNKLSITSLIFKSNNINPEILQLNIKPLSKGFDEIVKSLSKIVSKDQFRPAMTGVFLNTPKNELAATDANVLMTIPYKLSGKSQTINPKTNLNKLDKDVELYKNKYEIITGTYPVYKNVIPKYSNKSKVFELLPFLNQVKAIEKLANFFNENGQFVIKLLAQKQTLYLKAFLLAKLLTSMAEQGVIQFQFEWADEDARTRPILLKSLQNKRITSLIMPFLLDESDRDYAFIDFDLFGKSSIRKTNRKVRSTTKIKSKTRKGQSKRALSLKAKAIKLKLQLLKL